MPNIGINGFGRIGKCCFLQMIDDSSINIKAININKLSINNFQQYINNDSIHRKNNYKVTIISNDVIEINKQLIKIFTTSDPTKINWKQNDVDYLFETSGAFLTQEKAKLHNSDYIIMSAPPTDLHITPIFCYGVNEDKYNGEKIISTASCTTNCIAPFLKFIGKFKIKNANFITIHSATSSQSIVDSANLKKRTNRSVFNNIIPHTTGASDSLEIILPELKNKVVGTSVRIPVSNVSMIDLNVTFDNQITKEEILNNVEKIQNDVITLNKYNLVSSDFIGTTTPTIIDYSATIQLQDDMIKFTLWYDNEWSYAAQMIRMVKHMSYKNTHNNLLDISSVQCFDKTIMLRCDFNCPVNNNNEITDDFRIRSALPTINKILNDQPKKLIILTHFGRPIPLDNKTRNEKYSTKIFLPVLQKLLNRSVYFLEKGLDTGLEDIKNDGIYLMENVRFHDYETKPYLNKHIHIVPDIYCNEAFSASHRNHTSITNILAKTKCYGFCFIKEIQALNLINNSSNKIITAIIGGSKMEDKIPMLLKLSYVADNIYITGNNINTFEQNKDFFNSIRNNRANIIFTIDGFGNTDPEKEPIYIENIQSEQAIHNKYKVFDIGPKSLNQLLCCVQNSDIIFWNGTLGITEHPFYKNNSETLVNILNNVKADVIIGGGDTSGFVNNYKNNFYHISTGGGASIEYISNNGLPGIFYL
jgi:glyceraldehyde 3-phosphate dehydrogenase